MRTRGGIRRSLGALARGVPSGHLRWLWLAGMALLAVLGYTVLLWLPGSFVVPAGLWTAWVGRRTRAFGETFLGNAAKVVRQASSPPAAHFESEGACMNRGGWHADRSSSGTRGRT